MKKRYLIVTFLVCVTGLLLFVLYRLGEDPQVRRAAERRLSDLLHTDIQIGKVTVGLFPSFSLSRLDINSDKPASNQFLVGVKKIAVNYHFLHVIKREWNSPASVYLDSPRFRFNNLISSFGMLYGSIDAAKEAMFKKLEMSHGEFEFATPWIKDSLKLNQVSGKVWLDKDLKVHMMLSGKLQGLAIGNVMVQGSLRPGSPISELQIQLKDATLFPNSESSVTHLNGTILVNGTQAFIRNLKGELRGVPIYLAGRIDKWNVPQESSFELALRLSEKDSLFGGDMRVDLQTSDIQGSWLLWGRSFHYEGKAELIGDHFLIRGLKLENGFGAEATFNLQTGHYQFDAVRGEQRLSLMLQLAHLAADLNFKFDHLEIANHDVATQATIVIKPIDDASWNAGIHKLKATVSTDYLIFDYHPLRDFTAEFELTTDGFEGLKAKWGGYTELRGSTIFSHPSSMNLELLVSNLDLSKLGALGIHPMPRTLEGALQGKVNMSGPIRRPQLKGRFDVVQGKIGRLNFEEATINFSGETPYLALHDSKVVRKGRNFELSGAVNFALDNIFQEIKIVSKSDIVVWRGWDITREFDIEQTESQVYSQSAQTPNAGNGTNLDSVRSKVEADYMVHHGKSLSITAEEDSKGKPVVVIGPKIKF